MKPIHQTIFPTVTTKDEIESLPGPERGNCLQACVASLLELPLEDVPHFVSYSQENWEGVLECWFAERNLDIEWQPLGAPGSFMPRHINVMVTGKSPRGEFNHVVIYRDWQLVHDPHPSGDGLDGDPIGAYYLFPLRPEDCRTDVPALVAEVERLRAALGEVRRVWTTWDQLGRVAEVLGWEVNDA